MAKAAAAVAVIVRVDARLRFMSISFERGVVRSGTCGPLNARLPRLVNSNLDSQSMETACESTIARASSQKACRTWPNGQYLRG